MPEHHDDAPTPDDHGNTTVTLDVEALTDKDAAQEPGNDQKPHYPIWQWVLTLIALYLGALLYGLDTTIAADVQTAVYEQFGEIEKIAWVGIGFPMGSVACILLFGRLYTYFNTKILLNSSILIFEVGSALCGAAPSMNALIVGRVIAGLGGCGMYIGALTFLSSLGSTNRLVLYNALIGASWGAGAILGPVVGGAFSVSRATWRWAFYINLPLAALLSPVYLFVTPSYNPRPDLTIRQKVQMIDWAGVVLNAGMVVLLITALSFSGSTYPWSSSTVIALWTMWGVVTLAYVAQQVSSLLSTTEKRLFPVHFLKSWDLVLLYIATAAAATSNAVTLYYTPLFFAFTRGDTALEAAVRLLPFIVVFIFFIMFAGATLPLVGRYAPYYAAGGMFIVAGSTLMFNVRADTSGMLIYGYEVLLAAGAGITFQNGYAVASAKVRAKDKPNSIGFINTAQIGTTALALAMASCLYQNLGVQFLQDALHEYHFPGAFLRAALGGAGSTVLASAPAEASQLVITSVAFTISRMFGMGIAAGGLLLCTSLMMKWEKIDFSGAIAGGG